MSRPLVLFLPSAHTLLRSSSSCSLRHVCVRARTRPRKRAGTERTCSWSTYGTARQTYSTLLLLVRGAVTYARLSKVARACQFDEVWRPLEHYCNDKMNRRSILSSFINWYYCVRMCTRSRVCACMYECVWGRAYLHIHISEMRVLFDVARSLLFITVLPTENRKKKSTLDYTLRPEKMMHLPRWWLTVIFTSCYVMYYVISYQMEYLV